MECMAGCILSSFFYIFFYGFSSFCNFTYKFFLIGVLVGVKLMNSGVDDMYGRLALFWTAV